MGSRPGFEPGTSRTPSEYHIPRPNTPRQHSLMQNKMASGHNKDSNLMFRDPTVSLNPDFGNHCFKHLYAPYTLVQRLTFYFQATSKWGPKEKK